MKISILSGLSRSAGGVFYAVSSLATTMKKAGVDITVHGRRDKFLKSDIIKWQGVKVNPHNAFGPLRSSLTMRLDLIKTSSDLVHLHGLWLDDQWASLDWQQKTEKPVIISPHGMLDPWAIQNSGWKKKIIRKIFADESLTKATCIHALCEAEAHAIRAFGLKNPIATIPNGVNIPVLTNQEDIRSETGKGLAQRPHKKQLLFMGRIHPKKGLTELIQGWAKAKSKNIRGIKEWQLSIAGWGDNNYLRQIHKQASNSGLTWSTLNRPQPEKNNADICFLGPVFGDKKDDLLRSVNAFILPSFSEGLPVAVLEAWAYKLPVVMTDHCNLPEGFSANAALRIRPETESISKCLYQLFSMSDYDLNTVAGNGRTLAEKRFTWDRISQDMAATYTWCLGGNKPNCLNTPQRRL